MTEREEQPARPESAETCCYLRPGDQRTLMELACGAVLVLAVATGWYAWQNGGLRHVAEMTTDPVRIQVNLNEADWTELVALPAIGEKTARQIVGFRDRHGPFDSLQSLTRVDGIGLQTIKKIRPYISPVFTVAPRTAGRAGNPQH